MRSTKLLLSDERGATAVEFAILSPVLFMFIMAILEFSSAYFTQHLMENVSYNISRLGKTGYVEAGQTQEQTIRAMLTDRLNGMIDANGIVISSTTYEEFSDIDQNESFVDSNHNGVRDDGENFTDANHNGEYDGALSITGYGQAGQITVYEVSVPWQVRTPVLGAFVGEDGQIILKTHIVVRNEPYGEDDDNGA